MTRESCPGINNPDCATNPRHETRDDEARCDDIIMSITIQREETENQETNHSTMQCQIIFGPQGSIYKIIVVCKQFTIMGKSIVYCIPDSAMATLVARLIACWTCSFHRNSWSKITPNNFGTRRWFGGFPTHDQLAF